MVIGKRLIAGGALILSLAACTPDEVTQETVIEIENRGTGLLDYTLRIASHQLNENPDLMETQEFKNVDKNITVKAFPSTESYCLESYFTGKPEFKRHYVSTDQKMYDGGCDT